MQKRPLSAYMHFSQDQRSVVKEENPDVTFGAFPLPLSSSRVSRLPRVLIDECVRPR